MAYIPTSDKILLTKDSELKLVARETGGRKEFFDGPESTHFGNRISDVSEEVNLFLRQSDLDFVLKTLDFSKVQDQGLVGSLLARLVNDFDGQVVRVPYLVALIAVKSMMSVAVQQAQQIEQHARALEADELALRDAPDFGDDAFNE
jgi:hypothetical protein